MLWNYEFLYVPHNRTGTPRIPIELQTLSLYSKLQAYKYQEQYNEALAGFSQGAALDPTWSEPQEKEKELCNYLAKVHELVKAKVSNKNTNISKHCWITLDQSHLTGK